MDFQPLFLSLSPLLSALQSVPQVERGLFPPVVLSHGSLPLPCQCRQPVFILQVLVPSVSQDRMGSAVVTSSLPPPGLCGSHNLNLVLAHSAWWTLFMAVALGPQLMDAPYPLTLWPAEPGGGAHTGSASFCPEVTPNFRPYGKCIPPGGNEARILVSRPNHFHI